MTRTGAFGVRQVGADDVSDWLAERGLVGAYREARRPLGQLGADPEEIRGRLGIGPTLGLALETLLATEPDAPADALDSIPLHSLARGMYLPLSGMTPEAIGRLFGFAWAPPAIDEDALVRAFIGRDIGLSLPEKVGVLAGDPFGGQPSGIGFDSLLAILSRLAFEPTEEILARLPRIGDLGLCYIELTDKIKSDPPLTSREVLLALRGMPRISLARRRQVLGDLFARAGRLERYFVYRLIRRRLATGMRYKMDVIWRAIGEAYDLDPEKISNAAAIHDHLDLARIIESEGEAGLRQVVLRPLNPVLPALAGAGQLDPATAKWPLWIERKYDGIRIVCHRQADRRGQAMVACYTRRNKDWTMMLPELADLTRQLPVPSFILDGEIHAEQATLDGLRQASVYELYRAISSGVRGDLRLRYTAFDLLYLNGRDLTELPLSARRQLLEQTFGPMAAFPLPIPFGIADGQLAKDHNEFKVLFAHFRRQGFEGAMAKRIDAPYMLGRRTKDWLKRKPEVTLDLPLSGVYWSGSETKQMSFGAFRLSARSEKDGGWVEAGTVQALDQANNAELARRIMGGQLFTGRTLTHTSADGTRSGFELRPEIVVMVRFEGVVRDAGGEHRLRDPKIVAVRSDEISLEDTDSYEAIESLYLRERLG